MSYVEIYQWQVYGPKFLLGFKGKICDEMLLLNTILFKVAEQKHDPFAERLKMQMKIRKKISTSSLILFAANK